MTSAAYQNLTVLTPQSLGSLLPLEIIDDSSPIRAAFVERGGIEQLPGAWKDSCGFYILFSHMDPDGGFEAYVGKASNGFYRRLRSHDKEKPWWRAALMVFKDREQGFSSTQSAYLEGKMRETLEFFPNVTVHNIAATGDRTLPGWEESAMEAVVVSTLRIMRLRGYRGTLTPPVAETASAGRHRMEASDISSSRDPSSEPAEHEDAPSVDEEARFAALRAWRMEVAGNLGWPAFAVFKDSALREIARANPQNISDLYGVKGVTDKKAENYGLEVIRVLCGPDREPAA